MTDNAMAPIRITEEFLTSLLFEESNLLGEGAYGSVYLVKFEGQQAALKVGKSEDCSESITTEREVLQQLNGAGGSPKVLGYCLDPPALLMTYCRGKDLFRMARNGYPSDCVCLSIALKMCQAMNEVHQAGIVHCDFKPDNILVEMSEEGEPQEVHIIDYGLSCRFGHAFRRRFDSNISRSYCPCFFNGTPMQARCDVPGVAFTMTFLTKLMCYEYMDLEELLLKGFQAQHASRPSLDEFIVLLQELLRRIDETPLPAGPEAKEAQQPAGISQGSLTSQSPSEYFTPLESLGLQQATGAPETAETNAPAEVSKPQDLSEICKTLKALRISKSSMSGQ